MIIEREELLRVLNVARVGLTKKELLQQSNAVVFTDSSVITFNGEIFTRGPNPLAPDVKDVAVPAEDFIALLQRYPDDRVEIEVSDTEIRVSSSGKSKRSAGITVCGEVELPYKDVPKPGKWAALVPEMMGTMLQAARICGKDEAQPRTTEVHVTDAVVESCDGYRVFRSELETGFEGSIQIPAASIAAVSDITFTEFSVKDDYLHLRTKRGHRVSIRLSTGGKFPDLSVPLDMPQSAKISLPANMPEILERVSIMQDFNALASIKMSDGEIEVRTRKDAGWYRESRKVDYGGDTLRFDVNINFLREILEKTRNVRIGGNKIRIKSGSTVFVVCLEAPDVKKAS